MRKRDIIEILAKEKRVERMVLNITHCTWSADLSDLSQEIYVILLEYDDAKIEDVWNNNQLNFFLARVIVNQFRSSLSPFHMIYRRFRERSEDITGMDFIDED